MYDISIIIPVYNKEEYLSECLESILEQTYKNFEVICIDDCSNDGSRKVLDKYAVRDSRIKVIKNNENLGAGASRNIGIDCAVGEYLLILDADDIFDKELVRLAYTRCKEGNLDILLYDYRRMDNITKQKREFSVPLPIQRKISNRVFSSEDIEDFSFQMCLAASWVKMYRKGFIFESGIQFQNLSSSNDGFFGRSIWLSGGRFFYLGKSLATYRTNTKNQISKINEHSIFNFISAVKKIKSRLEEQKVFEKNKKSFCSYVLGVVLGYLMGMDRNLEVSAYSDAVTELCCVLNQDIEFLNNYQTYMFEDCISQTDIKKYLSEFSEYRYLFRYENGKICQLIKYLKNSGKKIVLWGYGGAGRDFFERSRMAGIPIDLIVDENYININENRVKAPENIGQEDCLVLITMAAYGKCILDRAIDINKNTILIDVQSYFTLGFDLKDCIFDRLDKAKLDELSFISAYQGEM